MSPIHTIHAGNFFLVAATIPAVASALVFSRVRWWQSRWGQHLMAYMSTVAAVFVLGCARLVFGDHPAFQTARSWTFGALVVVLWWRFIIVCQALLEGSPDDTNPASPEGEIVVRRIAPNPQVVAAVRDAASRAVRQGLQVFGPTLLILAGGGTSGLDIPRVLLLSAVTMLLSVLRSVTGWRVPDTASFGLRVADRAGVAAAGAALGFWSVDGLTDGTAIPWHAGLVAAVGAAAVAVMMMFTNAPPVLEPEAEPRPLRGI